MVWGRLERSISKRSRRDAITPQLAPLYEIKNSKYDLIAQMYRQRMHLDRDKYAGSSLSFWKDVIGVYMVLFTAFESMAVMTPSLSLANVICPPNKNESIGFTPASLKALGPSSRVGRGR